MTFLFLGILGGIIHIAGSQVRSFENSAAADISSKLQGDMRRVVVRADVGPEALWGDIHSVSISASHFQTQGLPLYTESNRSRRGVVRELRLSLQDFSLGQLHVDRMTADIRYCHFDFPLALNHRMIRLSQSGTGEGEVSIRQEDLERFILAKYHEIKRVTVKIDRDKIIVDGYGSFLIFSTAFTVIARLESPDGDTLHLTSARVLLDGQVADDASRQALLDTLDPVVDLTKDLALHGAIKVNHLELRDGVLRASGIAKIPELPAIQ
jgi:hypothetical protein